MGKGENVVEMRASLACRCRAPKGSSMLQDRDDSDMKSPGLLSNLLLHRHSSSGRGAIPRGVPHAQAQQTSLLHTRLMLQRVHGAMRVLH
jgi:hypothetical protein